MSRILPPERPGIFARVLFAVAKRMLGKTPTPMRVGAHHPGVLRSTAFMEIGQQGANSIPLGLKLLCNVKIATLIGCPF